VTVTLHLVTRIALATCNFHPELAEDDVPVLAALRKHDGVEAVAAIWDDPDVDWSSFDLVVLRSTWDYSSRREEFLAWATSVPRLLNPAGLVEWNTDKSYLRELADASLPTIPTIWLDPARNLSSRAVHTRMPAHGDFVIKPTVSRGSRDTGRYEAGEAHSRGLAIRHAVELLKDERHVMVQPYLTQVDTEGESVLVYIDGEFSHSVRKGAMLQGPFRGMAGLYKQEEMSDREATDAERAVADRVVAHAREVLHRVSDEQELLYARVDLVPGNDGEPVVIEFEVAEPSLFLSFKPGAAEKLAEAILARLA